MTVASAAMSNAKQATGPSWRLAGVGLVLLAALSLAPLLLETVPVWFVPPLAPPLLGWAAKVLVVALMCLAVVLRAIADRRSESQPGLVAVALVVLSGLLATYHWVEVDTRMMQRPDPQSPSSLRSYFLEDWQRGLYLAVLSHRTEYPPGAFWVPHAFRPLPYGFTRSVERITGDWRFACFAYRWFFTFWFLWASYRFIRVFHRPTRAWLALAMIAAFYPLSVRYYNGQLTDPMSHALFVLCLIYVVEDRWLALAGALFLGVMAKETAVVIVPAYGVCQRRQGLAAVLKTAFLGLTCTLAFVAARVWVDPDWRPAYQSINGTSGLMVTSNLAIGRPPFRLAPQMLVINYLHPLLFVGVFLPMIAIRWRWADPRLRALFLVLTPLLLASNLCFGWLYESRNYMPLLPVLCALALTPSRTDGKSLG
jgi:hypothetical protein